MTLDRGYADSRDRVADCDTRMRVRTRIDEDSRVLARSLLDARHELALGVRLERLDRRPELAGELFERCVDVRERSGAVHVRLARAEHVEVGSVDHEDGFTCGHAMCPGRLYMAAAISATSSVSARQRPIASQTMYATRSRSAFLSRRIARTSASLSRPDGTSCSSPSRWSRDSMRRASLAAHRPRFSERRAATPMPIATASP